MVARAVHIDPALKPEIVLFLAFFRTKVIEKSLNVLLHLLAELGDDRFVQLEEIERVVPAAGVRPARRVAIILYEFQREVLQSLVQVSRAVLAKINPGREQWHHTDLGRGRTSGGCGGGTIL